MKKVVIGPCSILLIYGGFSVTEAFPLFFFIDYRLHVTRKMRGWVGVDSYADKK